MTENTAICPQCALPCDDAEGVGGLYPRCLVCGLPLFLIAGKYKLLRAIGQGGYGVVFLAQHTLLPINPMRAIKFLPLQEDPEVLQRFRQEIVLTAGISQDNEHIVRVFDDFGEIPGLGYFYVMEYLQGQHLYHMIHKQPELLPLALVLSLGLQICSGLKSAHQAGIVHRDLKPENIFLVQRQERPFFVKIMDFGIAQLSEQKLNHPELEAVGTPHYMSPEQISARPQDHRADIYAFGVLMFEMLVGHPPFYFAQYPDMGVVRLLEHHLYIPPRSPSSLREDPCPHGLEELVMQCLAKEPSSRPDSMEEIKQALLGVQEQLRPTTREARLLSLLTGQPQELAPEELYVPYHTTAAYHTGLARAPLADAANEPASSGTSGELEAQTEARVSLSEPVHIEPSEPLLLAAELGFAQDEDGVAVSSFLWGWRYLWLLLCLVVAGWSVGWWFAGRNVPQRALSKRASVVKARSILQPPPDTRQLPRVVRGVVPTVVRVRPVSTRAMKRPLRLSVRKPRARPRQRRWARRVAPIFRPSRRREVMQAAAPAHPRIKGCPPHETGTLWTRINVSPARIRVQTSLPFLQFKGWICLQQALPFRPFSLKLTAHGYQPCMFRSTITKQVERLHLKPYTRDLTLDANLDYCLRSRSVGGQR